MCSNIKTSDIPSTSFVLHLNLGNGKMTKKSSVEVQLADIMLLDGCFIRREIEVNKNDLIVSTDGRGEDKNGDEEEESVKCNILFKVFAVSYYD